MIDREKGLSIADSHHDNFFLNHLAQRKSEMNSPTPNFAPHPLRHIAQHGHKFSQVVENYHDLSRSLDHLFSDAIERYAVDLMTNAPYRSSLMINDSRELLEREIDRMLYEEMTSKDDDQLRERLEQNDVKLRSVLFRTYSRVLNPQIVIYIDEARAAIAERSTYLRGLDVESRLLEYEPTRRQMHLRHSDEAWSNALDIADYNEPSIENLLHLLGTLLYLHPCLLDPNPS